MAFNQALLEKAKVKTVSGYNPAKLEEAKRVSEPKKAKFDVSKFDVRPYLPMQYPGEFAKKYFPAEEKVWEKVVRPFVKKAGKVFPATSPGRYLTEDIASGVAEFGKPSYIAAGAGISQATKGLMVKLAGTPAGRAFLQKNLPTFAKGLLKRTAGLPKKPLDIIRQRQLAEARIKPTPKPLPKIDVKGFEKKFTYELPNRFFMQKAYIEKHGHNEFAEKIGIKCVYDLKYNKFPLGALKEVKDITQ